jgi:hypothetical protein
MWTLARITGEEEEEDEEEMEAAYGGKAKMSKTVKAEKALFARVQAVRAANKTLERQLRLERFGREVDSMLSGGYRCGKFRNQMVEELADSSRPEAKIAFWKATMARTRSTFRSVARSRCDRRGWRGDGCEGGDGSGRGRG